MKTTHGTMADFDAYMERSGGTKKRVCRYKEVDGFDNDFFKTSCGHDFCSEWSVKELEYVYCPYCGRKIKEVK